MNFFKAQDKAYKNSFWLIVAFIFGVFLVVLVVNLFSYFLYMEFTKNYTFEEANVPYFYISLGVLAIISFGVLSSALTLSKGGQVVAEALGGILANKQNEDKKEEILLNIVDEMAIASGIPTPWVYILPDTSINAFAAGFSYEDAVVAVTRGAIYKLNRQELQAVIAHEFSHIFNGDMKLNLQTTSMIGGINIIADIGSWLIGYKFEKENKSEFNPTSYELNKSVTKDNRSSFAIAGLGFYVIGFAGLIITNFIKSLLLKQREFLADATAVKYTRDTTALANALKKIGADSGLISSPNASMYSHFYFATGISGIDNIFGTHPPLKKRILAIEPYWDGKFITTKTSPELEKTYQTHKELNKKVALAAVLTTINKSFELNEQDIENAKEKIGSIPPKLLQMTNEPFTARGVILALLANDFKEVSQKQIQELSKVNPKLHSQTQEAFSLIQLATRKNFLSIMQLCFPSLKLMSKPQYQSFRMIVVSWIYANKNLSFFEWILLHIIINPLDIFYSIKVAPKKTYTNFENIKDEASYFISCIATLNKAKEPKETFALAIKDKNLNFVKISQIDYKKLESTLEKLSNSTENIRKTLLEMSAICLSIEDEIENNQMLNAIALTLRIPLKSL